MAKSIISGLIQSGWPANKIIASNPTSEKLEALIQQFKINTTNDNLIAAEFAEIIVFCVKPQKMADVCSRLSRHDFSDKLVISVAAGYKIESIAEYVGTNTAVVRAMPNTPALIAAGATGIYANPEVTLVQKQAVNAIFSAVGTTDWVDEESQINIVTAIAGSSPAYVFLLMQSMIEQAVAAGMPEKTATSLVTQAVSGAAQLAQASPSKSLTTLRREVTSPGGTTAAAITSFKNDNFEDIVKNAVQASINRGVELGNQNK